MRVLAVRQPWASLIVEGLKTIEVRSKPTNIRERIAIYASTTFPTKKEIETIIHFLGKIQKSCYDKNGYVPKENIEKYNKSGSNAAFVHNFYSTRYCESITGKILGTAEIVGCISPGIKFDYELHAYEHLAPLYYYEAGKTYFWDLRRPVKFSEPIEYTPKRGAVVWSNFELPEIK